MRRGADSTSSVSTPPKGRRSLARVASTPGLSPRSRELAYLALRYTATADADRLITESAKVTARFALEENNRRFAAR